MALSLNEISRLKQWLYAILVSDPVIAAAVGKHPLYGVPQVYDRVAPEKSVYPLIVYQFMPEADKRGGFGARLFGQGAFLVKAVNSGTDESPIWPISDAFDADLQDAVAMTTPTGLIVMGCTRDLMHNQATVDDGLQYNELGGRYTVQFYMPGQSVPGAPAALSLSPVPTVQAQLDAINAQIGSLAMAVHQNNFKYTPNPTLTASATIARPVTPTTYPIDTTTAAVVITLPASAGDGMDLEFVRIAGTNPVTFALNVADTSPGNLANTALASIGDVQAFRDIALHVWEGH